MMLLIGIALLEMTKSEGHAGYAEKKEKEVHDDLLMLKEPALLDGHVLLRYPEQVLCARAFS